MEQNIIKRVLKFLIPSGIRTAIRKELQNVAYSFWIYRAKHKQRIALEKIRKKERVKVAFFVIHASVWKLDKVFQLMLNSKKFEPVIVICPYIVYGEECMLTDMREAYCYFMNKGYNTVQTYDEQTEKWLNVKKEIQPDIIFFTNPHKLTKEEYYITNYIDLLTCYVPYSSMVSYLYQMQYNQIFHNLLWLAFYVTALHKEIAQKYAKNKGSNVEITGYPFTDIFFDKSYVPKEKWKINNKAVKRIIWAPHHTIEDDFILNYSNFLCYSDFFKDLLSLYKDKIQIAFKPHPILKSKLYLRSDWGKEKTDQYYEFWQNQDNSQLEEIDYVDLFLTSDALILDSGSFLAEYFCTGKPELYMMASEKARGQFNMFGQILLNNVYLSESRNDIIKFIEEIVLEGNDSMKDQRNLVCQQYLYPSKEKYASQKIMDIIIEKLR
ncbi:hypothetical protein EZS27_011968 [termite gut metagenome]|uniref:CDP-glycerol:poly(Glycerophosphate) glycerophosphotransferase n=1 Tax=termite gut metagenome TaxID=433724 RepID=A0A5J4S252_9ZZZZ